MNHQSDFGYSTGTRSMRCAACGSNELGCCDGHGHALPRLRGAFQDGESFYRDAEAGEYEDIAEYTSCPLIVTYPGMVRGDHDTDGAVRARHHFAKEHPEFVKD